MSVIRNISYFLFAVLLSKGMGFLQSFVVAKALGPAGFGVWATLLILVAYAPIFSLGTVEALLKQVPYFLGRNDLAGVHEVESSVLGSIVLSSALVLLLALAAPFVLPFTSFHMDTALTVMVLLTIAINYFSCFFYHRFSAYEDFKMTGTMDAVRAAASLILVGGMAWAWGLRGAVIGYLLQEIVVFLAAATLNIRAHGRPGMSFHRQSILGAIKVGLPICLLWWVLTLSGTVDRIVLGGMLGAIAVGYYALGVSLSGILFLVPTVVGRVLYPRVNKHFGQNADAAAMRRVVLAPTLALGTLLINFQIGLLIATPLLYNQLLSKYHPGLRAGQILILGSFFVCLFRNGANYLIAANHERLFMKYIVATLIFNILFDVGLVQAGFGIEGVALGTSLAGLFLTTLVWRRVLKGLNFQRREQWATILALYFPFIVLVSAVGGVWCLHHAAFRTFDLENIVIGLLLIIAVNGALWCNPTYRSEMQIWKSTLLRKRRSAPQHPPVVSPVLK